MMKQMQKTVCALAVLATTSLPVMAESVDVRVIGTITPAACTPELTGGGTIDYGTMKPDQLNSDDSYTVLAERQLDFSVDCDAPAKVAIRAVNGRIGSLASGTEGASGYGTANLAFFGTAPVATGAGGLGFTTDGVTKIGGYAARLVPGSGVADTVAVDTIQSRDSGSTWLAGGAGMLFDNVTPRLQSWAATGTTLPVAFENLSATLSVQAFINRASELDLTQPITLDGLTTLELVYL